MSDSDSSDQTDHHVGRSTRSITRRNWLRVAGAGGVTALAGCPGDGGDGGDGGGGDEGTTAGDTGQMTTIEYWRWPHSTEPSNTGEDEIVEAFNAGPGADQDIEVEQVKNPFGDHNQALRTAIGGGDAPEVAWSFPAQLYDYAGKSRSDVEENAPFAFVDEYIDDDFRSQFYEPFWTWQEQRFNGLVGVPFIAGVDPGLMYVNVDAWDAAGLGDLPGESWSYEEYLNAVEQIDGTEVNGTTVNGAGAGLSDAASAAQWDTYLSVLSRTAGSLIGAGYQNTDGEYVMTLASDPELEAWNNIVGIPMENDWINNTMAFERDGMQDPFVSGQIGLLGHATFSRVEFSKDADFEFDIIPWPTKGGAGDYPVYAAGGFNVTFNAFSEEVGGNPEAAMEFIKFRNNAQNQYNWFNTSSQTVPNKEAYQLMQDEGVSDFVEDSRGLEVMHRVDEAMQQYADQQQAIKDRYPDIQTTDAGTPVTSMPLSVGSGRVHEAVGGALQRLAQNNNANAKEELTTAEEEWAQLISNAEDLTVNEPSIGFNKPEPQAGPL